MIATCPIFQCAWYTAYNRRKCRCGECLSQKAIADRVYRAANKDRIRARQRRWVSENLEHLRAKSEAWIEANPEKAVASSRKRALAYYHRNKERQQAGNRRWREQNPLKVKAIQQRRRASKRNAAGEHTADQLQARVAYFGALCYICNASYEAIDHVKPLARGGSNWPANLRPICKSCNNRKWAKPLSEMANYQKFRVA